MVFINQKGKRRAIYPSLKFFSLHDQKLKFSRDREKKSWLNFCQNKRGRDIKILKLSNQFPFKVPLFESRGLQGLLSELRDLQVKILNPIMCLCENYFSNSCIH